MHEGDGELLCCAWAVLCFVSLSRANSSCIPGGHMLQVMKTHDVPKNPYVRVFFTHHIRSWLLCTPVMATNTTMQLYVSYGDWLCMNQNQRVNEISIPATTPAAVDGLAPYLSVLPYGSRASTAPVSGQPGPSKNSKEGSYCTEAYVWMHYLSPVRQSTSKR